MDEGLTAMPNEDAAAIGSVLVADDHPLFREALASLVADLFPGARVDQAGRMDEVFAAIEAHGAPALILIDLLFPDMDIAVSLPQLRRRCPRASVVVVSMVDDEDVIARVMRSGADGFINKAVPNARCVAAIRRVVTGEYVVELEHAAVDPAAGLGLSGGITLTARQHDILAALVQDQSNKEIARGLDISPFTVRWHLSALMRMLGVARRADLREKAIAMGLVTAGCQASRPAAR